MKLPAKVLSTAINNSFNKEMFPDNASMRVSLR